MRFICPSCSAELYAPEEEARGGAIRCPECSEVIGFDKTTSILVPKLKNTLATGNSRAETRSLKSLFSESSRTMTLILNGSIVTYLLGIFWPLMTIKKKIFGFSFKGETVSLASGLVGLVGKGDILLFLILFTFSIAFPIGKLIVLFRLWHHPYARGRYDQLAHRLAVFGKWSMLDVIVVGLLVVIVKIEGMVSVEVHAGVYFFALSVILTMLTTAWIGKMLAKRAA